MINWLALLATFLGLVAIALYCALLYLLDRNKVLRTKIGTVPTSQDMLQGAALDLMTECRLLEQRNDYLEQRQMHCQQVVAMSVAQSRVPRRDRINMIVAEMKDMEIP